MVWQCDDQRHCGMWIIQRFQYSDRPLVDWDSRSRAWVGFGGVFFFIFLGQSVLVNWRKRSWTVGKWAWKSGSMWKSWKMARKGGSALSPWPWQVVKSKVLECCQAHGQSHKIPPAPQPQLFISFIPNGQIRLTYGTSQSGTTIVRTTRDDPRGAGGSWMYMEVGTIGVKMEESHLINKRTFQTQSAKHAKKKQSPATPHHTYPIPNSSSMGIQLTGWGTTEPKLHCWIKKYVMGIRQYGGNQTVPLQRWLLACVAVGGPRSKDAPGGTQTFDCPSLTLAGRDAWSSQWFPLLHLLLLLQRNTVGVSQK